MTDSPAQRPADARPHDASAAEANPKRCFRVVLPLLWLGLTAGSMAHPGDELGFLAFGGVLGVLPALPLQAFEVSTPVFYAAILVAGACVSFLIGWLLDRQEASRALFGVLWLTLGAALCAGILSRYPTLAKARSANGSIEAYVFFALNLSLTLSCVLVPLLSWLQRRRQRVGA